MTGWQGNDGGYGGWNQPQDPYGADPYRDPYGQNPYGGGDPYGANPYGPGHTAAYPTGQPGFGFEPPPPKRSKLPIVLSVVAIVAVVGAVVTIVLLNRQDDPQPAAGSGTESSTSAKPSTKSSAPPTSRSSSPSTGKPSGNDSWTTIGNADAGLSYQVPPDWKKSESPVPSGLGDIEFAGAAEVGSYNCGDAGYTRGFVASGDVQASGGGTIDLNKTITDFARSFGTKYYSDAKVDLPAAQSTTTVDGTKAATLTAKVGQAVTNAECQAATGEVAMVGMLIEENGEPVGVRMVVVVNDLSGGPADPPAPPDPLAEEILATVRVAG